MILFCINGEARSEPSPAAPLSCAAAGRDAQPPAPPAAETPQVAAHASAPSPHTNSPFHAAHSGTGPHRQPRGFAGGEGGGRKLVWLRGWSFWASSAAVPQPSATDGAGPGKTVQLRGWLLLTHTRSGAVPAFFLPLLCHFGGCVEFWGRSLV